MSTKKKIFSSKQIIRLCGVVMEKIKEELGYLDYFCRIKRGKVCGGNQV